MSDDPLIEFPFPLPTDDSYKFAFKDAAVVRAALYANGVVISVLKFEWSEDRKDIPHTDLNFLGDKPFHAALGRGWTTPPKISLFTRDMTLPSLIMMQVGEPMCWTPDIPHHCDTVTVGSDDGEKTLDLYYLRHAIGFVKKDG